MAAGRVMTKNWKSAWESMSIEEGMILRGLMQEVLAAKLKDKQQEGKRKLRFLNQLPTVSGKNQEDSTCA